MDLNLPDKTAIISGSTAGIGFALAKLFVRKLADALAQEGATVVVNGRTSERVDAAIKQIHHATPNAKLQGYEARNLIRKGQIEKVEKGDVIGQISFINKIFGIAAVSYVFTGLLSLKSLFVTQPYSSVPL